MSYSPQYTRIGFPRPTPAIAQLMIVNVAVFVANAVSAGRLSEPIKGGWLALSWDAMFEGYGLGVLRLLSYQFTHSFLDPWHLLYNLVALYFFGGIAERSLLGYLGTIKLYLCGGIVGGMLHMAVYAAILGQSVPVVGASGSCYALLLYAVATKPRLEIWCLFFNFQLIFLGFLMVGIAIYSTFVELAAGVTGSASHGAHLGGALAGLAVWKLEWFRDYRDEPVANVFGAIRDRVHGWARQRRAASAANEQQEIDRLLEKIQQQGLPSLTATERRTLERASQRAKRK